MLIVVKVCQSFRQQLVNYKISREIKMKIDQDNKEKIFL